MIITYRTNVFLHKPTITPPLQASRTISKRVFKYTGFYLVIAKSEKQAGNQTNKPT